MQTWHSYLTRVNQAWVHCHKVMKPCKCVKFQSSGSTNVQENETVLLVGLNKTVSYTTHIKLILNLKCKSCSSRWKRTKKSLGKTKKMFGEEKKKKPREARSHDSKWRMSPHCTTCKLTPKAGAVSAERQWDLVCVVGEGGGGGVNVARWISVMVYHCTYTQLTAYSRDTELTVQNTLCPSSNQIWDTFTVDNSLNTF